VKTRIDQLLVARGLFDSRSQARAAIVAGLVLADGVIVRKASEQFSDDIALEEIGRAHV
jgi:23S rRNA (cytidine1920-2'-O)/16S rRNA (cytidine1409-2'-O)-methyltransferase